MPQSRKTLPQESEGLGGLAAVAGAPAALVANGLLVALGAHILAARAPAYRFGSSGKRVD